MLASKCYAELDEWLSLRESTFHNQPLGLPRISLSQILDGEYLLYVYLVLESFVTAA